MFTPTMFSRRRVGRGDRGQSTYILEAQNLEHSPVLLLLDLSLDVITLYPIVRHTAYVDTYLCVAEVSEQFVALLLGPQVSPRVVCRFEVVVWVDSFYGGTPLPDMC